MQTGNAEKDIRAKKAKLSFVLFVSIFLSTSIPHCVSLRLLSLPHVTVCDLREHETSTQHSLLMLFNGVGNVKMLCIVKPVVT